MNNNFIHQSSVIETTVIIGEGTRVWHFTHIDDNAFIGVNCSIGQNCYIGKNVRIGNFVKIQNNVSVYSGVEIEDYVFCGPSSVFTNDLNPRSKFPKDSSKYLKTLVRKGSSIGANATILCGITIGKYAFIAAGSVVTKDVLNHSLVMGVPAKHSSWICECGEKLNSSLVCLSCKRNYIEKEDGLVEL
jgi:UDP-2-acetamido-3-amino-2,3-dideoxy-glucuronate N-acetyltransferase